MPQTGDARHGDRLLDSLGPLLGLPAWLAYRPALALRGAAYDLGWRPIFTLPVPVLSVGNLTLGGTGKTPLVAWLVQQLKERGRRVRVLARGYGGDVSGNDEAQMLGGGDLVVCNPDRVAGGRQAMADGADCLILDDGFQHRRLARQLDLVCIDASRPWGRDRGRPGFVFPMGRLREPRRALRRAHGIVLTRCDQTAPEQVTSLRKQLGALGIPIIASSHRPQRVSALDGSASAAPDSLQGQKAVAVSAIGHPAAFERSIAACGGQVIARRRFPDHHRFSPVEVQRIEAMAREADATPLCTAKDAGKLLEAGASPLWRQLDISLALDDQGQPQLDELLDHFLTSFQDTVQDIPPHG